MDDLTIRKTIEGIDKIIQDEADITCGLDIATYTELSDLWKFLKATILKKSLEGSGE